MKIGIDISQIAYEKTGVANYTKNLVDQLLRIDHKNKYILFFSSLRKKYQKSKLPTLGASGTLRGASKITIKSFRIPPTLLDILWNRLHIMPIEWLIGDIDMFFSSDWLQPPTKAKKVTTIHDLTVLKYPEEMHPKTEFNSKNLIISPNIVEIQKRRLKWVKKEADLVICDSQATKKDAMEVLGINEKRLRVVYPGGIC
jgi:hypothetical protein